MKNPLTASERRGILVVAAIALIITGCGWGISRCDRSEPDEPLPEIEVLVHGDSSLTQKEEEVTPKPKRKRRKAVNDSTSSKKKKGKKVYRQRSPLDELI